MAIKNEPKIVILDIETLPDAKAIIKYFPQLSDYPGQTLKASLSSVLCFGYKVLGDSKINVVCAWDDAKRWARDINDDTYVLKKILEILEDADGVVSHNGKRFDYKFIQTRLLKARLPGLRKIPHEDTCTLAKQNLLLFNNRLQTVVTELTEESKLENGGWDLWVKIHNEKHKPSMDLMKRYCAQDIKATEAAYKVLRQFSNIGTNMNIIREIEDFVCPKCGSTRIIRKGKGFNKQGVYTKVHCPDCRKWSSMKDETKQPKPI